MPSALKHYIVKEHPSIPVLQPEKATDPVFLEKLKEIGADLFVVVAFGQILPQTLLDIPAKGCINIHASLLPKYRGAAPMQRCLLNGDKETGVAIQKMVKQLDAGDVIATAKIEILPDMTLGELQQELCDLAKPLLLLVLQSYESGIPPAEPQDHDRATYAPKISVEEGEINWERPAIELHNLIRAFSPKPGAWSWVYLPNGEKRRIKILRTILADDSGKQGAFLSTDGTVACGTKSLKILELQPEGKTVMKARDWLIGFRDLPHF